MATGNSRDGKPVTVGDSATICGQVTNITGSGSTASVTVLLDSGLSIVAQARDMFTQQNG